MNEKKPVKLFMTDEEKLEEYKKADRMFKIQSGLGVLIIFVLIIVIATFNNANLSENLDEVCGILEIDTISLSRYVEHEDGSIVCVFDNGLPPYLDTAKNEQSTNPDYKVCYKIFNLNDKNEYELGGQTC